MCKKCWNLFINVLFAFFFYRNTLRVTRSASLKQIESTGNNNTFLGKRNKDFSFDDLKPFKIDFVECSLKGKDTDAKPDMNDVEDWLIKIA